jgi:dephospho-CoA kinase
VNRRAVAARVFADEAERKRLESLVHPLVNAERESRMAAAADDTNVKAFVWDTPLLVETGLHTRCNAVVFVDTPLPTRIARVKGRGWSEQELARRENLQMPLDKKRGMAQYVIRNAAEADTARSQVRQVFSRILAESSETI